MLALPTLPGLAGCASRAMHAAAGPGFASPPALDPAAASRKSTRKRKVLHPSPGKAARIFKKK